MASNTPAVPAFLTFLFDPKRKHDVYFLVGNQDHATPEKIGAVKMMLSAHSEVFYRELEDSKLAEKDVIPVIDICPQTFRNLLKYIYGYDIISSCTFDEADNLLYVAEKYLMDPLKNKLALRLMSLLNCDNICSLMNNPACYRHLELNDAITEILQTETKRVLESPQFLNMSSGAFLKLLEQEAMNVPEVEVWRAAVKWAKDKVRCDEGEKMRNELTPHVKHIRFCTMSSNEICEDVAPTRVLRDAEVGLICLSIGTKQKQDDLTNVCNIVELRKTACSEAVEIIARLPLFDLGGYKSGSFFTLSTKQHDIHLSHAIVTPTPKGNVNSSDDTIMLQYCITVTLFAKDLHCIEDRTPIKIRDRKIVRCRESTAIPLTVKGHNLKLLANSMYNLSIEFDNHLKYTYGRVGRFSNDHLVMDFHSNFFGNYFSHIEKLVYTVY